MKWITFLQSGPPETLLLPISFGPLLPAVDFLNSAILKGVEICKYGWSVHFIKSLPTHTSSIHLPVQTTCSEHYSKSQISHH